MKVERQVERRHGDRAPEPEIHAPIVTAHHPAQEHIQPLAGRAFVDRRKVLLRTDRVRLGEKLAAKIGENGRDRARGRITPLEELAQTAVTTEKRTQRPYISDQVLAVEGPMHADCQLAKLLLRSIFHEIRRGVVHIRHHPAGIADDRAAVAPGDSRREKARDFTVFAPLETMRHADRIGSDELRPVVAVVQGFEQLAQRFELHKNRVNGIY